LTEPIKVAFVALGCAKNTVDSEKMLAQLAENGAMITGDEHEADVIVINTCGFLAASRDEAHEEIREAIRKKEQGNCRRVVVAGCLVQRDGQQLLKDLPGIDALVGVHRRDDVVRAALKNMPTAPGSTTQPDHPADLYLGDYHPYVALDTVRLRITPEHYAYLRLSEGCDQKCTFCTIPAIRGPVHSKPLKVVLEEARELISDGVKELNIIGQDTTSYGQDLGLENATADLLNELNKLDDVHWIRLLYAYPTSLSDEIIEAVARNEKVVKYIDLPLQHINDRILKAMHRRVTRRQIETLLEKLRQRIPNLTIRSTFITGFPGETGEEFNELVDFVRQAQFSAVGVFPFSREPDTPAGRMKDQLPEQLKQERADILMAAQQEIAFAQARLSKGRSFEVLVEEQVAEGQFIGRHAGQAPEVDGATYILSDNVRPGQFVTVTCEDADGYDLIARPSDAKLTVR
jgi:ribosomal protein S12 methylthiotransferase